jgi:hypothetical protein
MGESINNYFILWATRFGNLGKRIKHLFRKHPKKIKSTPPIVGAQT